MERACFLFSSVFTDKVCSHCAKAMDHDEIPVLIREDVFPMHDHCADETAIKEAWHTDMPKGSLPFGIMGAAIAAIVGAIPWAIVLPWVIWPASSAF